MQIGTLSKNGCYVIADWLPKLEHHSSSSENMSRRSKIRFSQWLESLRKDVECTFDIMKCRWKILKFGIRWYSLEKCDQTWKTCCVLHDMLLDKDDLAKKMG